MKTKYIDLIEQTYDFPQQEFQVTENCLSFHGIDLMDLIRRFGTPLKFSFLPKISTNIQCVKNWFANAMQNHGYRGNYPNLAASITVSKRKHLIPGNSTI